MDELEKSSNQNLVSKSQELDTKGDLESSLNRLIDRSIDNPQKVLEILINAIVCRSVDPAAVRKAVKQTIYNAENQLRVFQISVAKTQLTRILRLIQSIDLLEKALNHEETISQMRPQDMIRAYALQQDCLTKSLDYIKRIADMRIELQQAANSMTNREIDEIDNISQMSFLSSEQRNRVRRIVEGMVTSIVTEDQERKFEDNLEAIPFTPPSSGSNGEQGK